MKRKKLELKKQTIVNLNKAQTVSIKGGATRTGCVTADCTDPECQIFTEVDCQNGTNQINCTNQVNCTQGLECDYGNHTQ